MSDKFHVGQRVRIKRTAFADSTDLDEIALRGKEGVIFQEPTDKGDGWTVHISGGGLEYLEEDEMEPLS